MLTLPAVMQSQLPQSLTAQYTAAQIQVGSGQGQTNGIVVDGTGSLYIACSNGIFKEILSGEYLTGSLLPIPTLSDAEGVAVGGSGNLYIADTAHNRVVKETPAPGSYTETVIPTHLYLPK
jgi:streptogramin lyase